MKISFKISFGAILIALSVILLLLGGIIGVLDLASAALASLCVVIAVIEAGYGYAFLIYAATSVIGILLLPAKTPVLFFAAFLGYYPLIKSLTERLSVILSYVLKLLSYTAAFAVIATVSVIFMTDGTAGGEELWIWYAILYFAGAAVFIVYDLALTRLIYTYLHSIRKKLGIGRYGKR